MTENPGKFHFTILLVLFSWSVWLVMNTVIFLDCTAALTGWLLSELTVSVLINAIISFIIEKGSTIT